MSDLLAQPNQALQQGTTIRIELSYDNLAIADSDILAALNSEQASGVTYTQLSGSLFSSTAELYGVVTNYVAIESAIESWITNTLNAFDGISNLTINGIYITGGPGKQVAAITNSSLPTPTPSTTASTGSGKGGSQTPSSDLLNSLGLGNIDWTKIETGVALVIGLIILLIILQVTGAFSSVIKSIKG